MSWAHVDFERCRPARFEALVVGVPDASACLLQTRSKESFRSGVIGWLTEGMAAADESDKTVEATTDEAADDGSRGSAGGSGFRFDAEVASAVAASNLGMLGTERLDRLLEGVGDRLVAPGALVQWDGETRPHLHLVVAGVIRMFVRAPDGRSMTVRYCRTGSLIGVASLFATEFRLPVSIEALSAGRVLDLRPALVTELAARDPMIAGVMLVETSERVQAFVEELHHTSFMTVPQRVARHVLDLAVADEAGMLAAKMSQEALAAATGTVREVAARALRELRDQGLVRTERGRIRVVDPDGLVSRYIEPARG